MISMNAKELMDTRFGKYDEWPIKKLIDDGKVPSPSPSGPWIAGGAVRGIFHQEEKTDIDVFFSHREQYTGACAANGADPSELVTKVRKDGLRIDLVGVEFYPNTEALLDSFDFTICQFAYDGESIICGEYSLVDLYRKRLAVHKISFASSSVIRLLKYAGKGFTVCSGTASDILTAAAKDQSLIRMGQYID